MPEGLCSCLEDSQGTWLQEVASRVIEVHSPFQAFESFILPAKTHTHIYMTHVIHTGMNCHAMSSHGSMMITMMFVLREANGKVGEQITDVAADVMVKLMTKIGMSPEEQVKCSMEAAKAWTEGRTGDKKDGTFEN